MKQAILILLLLCSPVVAQQRVDFRKVIAPVELIKPSGRHVAYGSGANTDAARGAAFKQALDAFASGDEIRLGPGTFEVADVGAGNVVKLVDDSSITVTGAGSGRTIIESAGDDGILSLSGTTTATIRGVGFNTGDGVSFTDYEGITHQYDVDSLVDLAFNPTSGAGTIYWHGGRCISSTGIAIDPTGCTTNIYGVSFNAAAACIDVQDGGAVVNLYNCDITTTGSGQEAIIVSSGCTARLFSCRITSAGDGQDLVNAGTIEVDASTVYNPAKTTGTITKLAPFGDATRLRKSVTIPLSDPAGSDLTTGDGKNYWPIPAELNGWNIIAVKANVTTTSSSGNPQFQLARTRSGSTVDVCSTRPVIDASELTSLSGTVAVVNASNDDMATDDLLRGDVDTAGTGTKGASLTITFEKP